MTFLRITNIAQNYQEQSLGNSEQSLGNSERKVSLDKNARIGAHTRVPRPMAVAREGEAERKGEHARGGPSDTARAGRAGTRMAAERRCCSIYLRQRCSELYSLLTRPYCRGFVSAER